ADVGDVRGGEPRRELDHHLARWNPHVERVFRIQRAPVRRLRGGQQFRRRLRRLGLVGEGRAAGGGERESEDRGQAAGKRHRAAPWRWPPILPQVGDQDFFLPPPSCLLTVAQAIR